MNKSYMIRTINRKKFLILCIIIFLINLLDFYNVNNEITYVDKHPLQSAWTMNMMMVGSWRLGGFLYMFLVFLLASIPLSDLLVEDRNSGLINQILLKVDKKTYIRSAYINNFIYGGIFSLLPVIINLLLWMMVRPLFSMNFISANISNSVFLFKLFLSCTPLFFIVHFLFIFILGGMIASLSLLINDKLNNLYVGGLVVLAIDIILSICFLILGDIAHYGLRELIINRSFPDNIYSRIYLIIVFILPILYMKNKVRKEEIV